MNISCRSAQQLADERWGQSRRDQYCIFVPGRPPLTNGQAAREIIEEAKKLIQQDLQAMGFGMVIQKRSTDHRGSFKIISYSFNPLFQMMMKKKIPIPIPMILMKRRMIMIFLHCLFLLPTLSFLRY